jgi:hypothetical protein
MGNIKTKHWRQHAMILGRVERLLGSDCRVNPYPVRSEQWMAFREGWFRDFDEPVIDELCKQKNTSESALSTSLTRQLTLSTEYQI